MILHVFSFSNSKLISNSQVMLSVNSSVQFTNTSHFWLEYAINSSLPFAGASPLIIKGKGIYLVTLYLTIVRLTWVTP